MDPLATSGGMLVQQQSSLLPTIALRCSSHPQSSVGQLSASLQSPKMLHSCPASAIRPILAFRLVLLPLPEVLLGLQLVVVVAVQLVLDFLDDHLGDRDFPDDHLADQVLVQDFHTALAVDPLANHNHP